MKRYKSLIALLLVALLVMTMLPVSAAAAGKGTAGDPAAIIVESTSAKPGSTVTVDVEIQNNPGVLGATLKLTFDTALTLIDAEAGEAFSTLVMTAPGQFTSPCTFTWDGQELSAEDIQDGTILTLTFRISEEATIGRLLPIEISYRDRDIVDADLEPITVALTNGGITVINYQPGDVNDDGYINSTDVILMRRYIAGGYSITINEAAADVNDDGLINSTDVIYSRRYQAGGYGVELLPSHERCSHELQAYPSVAATCTQAGNLAYWQCTLCEKYFIDAQGTEERQFSDLQTLALDHVIVIDAAVAATYTSTGLTEGQHCSR